MRKSIFLIAILLFILLFPFTVVAADWNFYGSARVTTFVSDNDVPAGNDTTTLEHTLQSNARIGARVKVNDAIGGRFEYSASVSIRHLYGTWNFDSGEILVGQTYSPLNIWYSKSVYRNDRILLNYGSAYSGRHPMVRFRFGDFQIAAVEPESPLLNAPAGSFTEVTFPKIEAKYDLKLEKVLFSFAGGFNTYELTDTATGIAHDVDSYILAIGGKVIFGSLQVCGNFWVGENVGSYGLPNAPVDEPAISGNTLVHNDAYGFTIVISNKMNDMFSFEAGYGHTEAELDDAVSNEDTEVQYYVQSTITFVPGVFIVPEIGVVDGKQDASGNEDTETVYYGLKWQINF